MIDFKPENICELKARYAKAIEPLFIQSEVVAGAATPGLFRQHVFDTMKGVRIIISREQADDGTIFIHYSGSIHGGKARQNLVDYRKHCPQNHIGLRELYSRQVQHAFSLISGRLGTMIGWSNMGIPHYELKTEDATPC